MLSLRRIAPGITGGLKSGVGSFWIGNAPSGTLKFGLASDCILLDWIGCLFCGLCWDCWICGLCWGCWICGRLPWETLIPLPLAGLLLRNGCFCSSSGGGGVVEGTSQSTVGGETHLLDCLSKTRVAGQRWRRGYPPWQAQYLSQDFPKGTLAFGSSLQRAEINI